jgi:hypothetical protein
MNNLDKREYSFDVNDQEDSRSFFHFYFSLEDGMPDGEYTYTLFNDDDVVVATGLLQVGDYKAPSTAYTKNNSFKQYNG